MAAVVHDITDLRHHLGAWRNAGERIVLVPTMGALHAGHISLVHAGKVHGQRVAMSIFVNPTQFAPHEDLSTYPRTLAADVAKFTDAGGDLVFAPNAESIYPQGFVTTISLGGPATAGLEDKIRPTHFAGVATIVAKLFNLVRPDAAIFGEKDYQQLKVLSAMARDLDFETEILAGAIVREADGLALSSRNIYLSADERARAPALQKALVHARAALKSGAPLERALSEARGIAEANGFIIDYLEARHAETLARTWSPGEPLRLLAAARIGATRLIDNVAL